MTMTVPLSAQTKKYDLNSSIVTFGNTMSMGKRRTSKKIVLSFDDDGMKECKVTHMDDTPEETFLNGGKTLCSNAHTPKAASKRGEAHRGTRLRFGWDGVPARDEG